MNIYQLRWEPKNFADDTAKYYICNDCQLGEYEYEILGVDEFLLSRKEEDL